MIRVDPFNLTDASALVPQDGQARDWPSDLGPYLRAFAGKGRAFTLRAEGRVLCIMGLMEVHHQAATAWAIMASGCWGHMGEMTIICRRYLDDQPFRRIDMLVRAGFPAGQRWAERLGFEREAVLRAWAPDGEDMMMFARIRGETHG